GTTYARFRLTTDSSLTDLAGTTAVDERSIGSASGGEVEDYQVAISASSFDISGTLYVDSNSNDIFENPTGGGSEALMPENITVRLLSSDGSTELATTVTDTNGLYSLPDLAPSTYQVAVEITDPDIPIGHNIGTPTPLTISLTSADATGQNFGFDLTTTGGEVTFCQSPNGEVYSGGISNDIYAIYPSTGATFRVTNTALARVVNSLATDHFYRVAYYAEGQAIYAWDPINDTHVRLRDNNGNLNASAMPGGGSISSLTSGGAAFFNGSYYLGIERAQGNSNTDVYRVDFVPGSNGLVIQSLTALGVNDNTGGANGGLNSADWGDMIISDAGVIYGATRRAGLTWSFDLSTSIYNQISNNYLGQLAKDGEGVLWGLSDTSRIQRVDINTGSLFGPSSPTSSPIADMAECVVGLSTIGDRIWDDLDGDGIQDPLEPGIANVTVGIYRDLNGNGVIDTIGSPTIQDPLLTTQVTNSSGNYDFVDLIRGNYIIKVLEGTADDLDSANVLDGAVLTTTTTTPSGQQAVTIPLGINDYNDADFGYQLPIIPKDPNVLLVKRITQINGSTDSAGGNDLSDYIDQIETTNPYDDNDITVADPVDPTDPPKDTNLWPTPLTTTLVGGIDGGNVMSNDEIEYTIYYLSSGDATAESVLFCDYVPTFTSYIPNAYTGNAPQASGGIGGADLSIELFRNGTTDYHTGANDGDSATYFAPGTDPATSFPGIDCDGDSDGINANTNGAVVVNLGDLPDAATDATGAYGYVRFRARVK
ncbi:MAG: SdrD B-like domain-containing protein, partial [Cyanobacteria bacterium P01_D01_bin.56]